MPGDYTPFATRVDGVDSNHASDVNAPNVALGQVRTGRYNALTKGALGDNATDNATAFAAWKAAIPARGGIAELPQGVYKTSGTLLVPSYTHLEGAPGTGLVFGGGDYLSGSCLLWTGAANGTVLSFFGATLSAVKGINVNGGGVAGVAGVLFDSNNAPASKTNALEAFQVYACGVPGTSGYGVRIGTSAALPDPQADTVLLRRGMIVDCDTGVDIRSLNAGYQCVLEQVAVIGHRKGVALIGAANNKIDSCDFGGHASYTVADIWEGNDGAGNGGAGAPTLIVGCQTEGNPNGTTWFLLVDSSCSADLTQPYTLMHNRITECGILLNQTRILNLYSNEFYGCNVVVGGGFPVIFDFGNTFNGVGMRNIADIGTTSGSATITSAGAANFVAGDVGKRIVDPTSGAGGIAAAGIPLGALIATVVDATHATMANANGTAVAATATASGVSIRIDYGFVIPQNTGELISSAVNPVTDLPQQEFRSRNAGDVARVTSVNPAASWIGYGIDARVAGGHHWQMVAGGASDPGAFYLLDGAGRVFSINPNCNTDALNVNAWGIAVVGEYARSQTAVKTANYVATSADGTILCDPTAGGFAVTLPANTALLKGRRYTIVNAGASTNTITVGFADGSTVNGAATATITAAWGRLVLEANGNNRWYVVG